MGWNRERVIFALSILIFLGSLFHTLTTFLGGGGDDVVLSEPRAATVGVVGGEVAIDWFPGGSGDLRDPFQAKSEWRPARPDHLVSPPYRALKRRIPLPGPVARGQSAWPGLENALPIEPDEVNE